MSDTTAIGPYATAARLYRTAGWAGVLPVGNGPCQKFPPPIKFTGHGNPDPSGADVEAWIETHGDRNIGLRAPEGVIGLDVDAYEKGGVMKTGGEELARLVAQYGPLPPTWVSGARPAPSGIYWYRVPPGHNWPGEAGKGIEIVSRSYRYGVVWPSVNPEAGGARYVWRLGTYRTSDVDPEPPRPTDLEWLPEAWVRGLTLPYDRTDKTELGDAAMSAWWGRLRDDGTMCPPVERSLALGLAALRSEGASRHDAMTAATRALVNEGGKGHSGVPRALGVLEAEFASLVGAERVAGGEWSRAVAGAVELAATEHPTPNGGCICNVAPLSPMPPPPSMPIDPTTGQVVVPIPKVDVPVEAETLTDAQIVARVHEEVLRDRYVWAHGLGWLRWQRLRWVDCPEEAVIEQVRLWAVDFVQDNVSNPFVGAVRETRTLLIGLLGKYRLTAIVTLARGLCRVDASEFDAHADLLNTPAGVVSLETGACVAHDPALYMTKVTTDVMYRQDAEHADWRTALAAVPADVADWLQVRFGQAVTGHMTPDDVLLILRGGGENGKSTILNAIKSAIGMYGTYISDRVLMADPNAHPTEMMDFRGARFALTEELPDEGRLNVKRLKDVIGTPVIKARRMRQDPVEFPATHSFFISTNPTPIVTDTDHGTWRRLALVRFPYRYRKPHEALEGLDDRRGDPGLRDRLRDGQAQREAVLAWLVTGARRWYAAGKVMPEQPASVQADTLEWRASSDPIEGFWRESLRASPEHFITTMDMMAAFNAYLAGVHQREWSDRRFTPAFAEHSTTKRNGVVYKQARVQVGQVRSYRLTPVTVAPSPFVPDPTAAGSKVRAWWGVRFVNGTDAEQD